MRKIDDILCIIEEELRQEINGEYPFNKNLNQGYDLKETIYHYTDLNGLIGIIENQCLFSTNIGFVNDNKELIYGREFILRTIPQLKNTLTEYIKPELIDAIVDSLNSIQIPEFYTTCFSKEKDLLSLWRGYADNGQGIAIGFYSGLRNSINQMLQGSHVKYDTKIQKAYLKEILKISLSFIIEKKIEHKLTEEEFELVTKKIISNIILEDFLTFKDKGFKEENEYRYIVGSQYIKNDKKNKIHFRTNGKFLIPYIKLEAKAGELLPINEIIVGPCNYQSTLKRGIIRLLIENGYNNVPINFSDVPFRN
jgi:hypothetical protein